MATFYISTTGNDTTGNGSIGTPWRTLKKATTEVVTSGDTIYVNAGTYTETQQCDLAVGVSIEGANRETAIIKSSLTTDWSTLLNVESGSVTNGNQTISKITFDGQYVSESNKKCWTGIWVTLRSNVVIDNCRIQNFYDRGVIVNGNGDNSSTIPVDPGIYTTGNRVTNCIFSNTARNTTGYIAGQLNVGGTQGMVIEGNSMTQNQRVSGKNGELIKYWGSGYNLGLKILNNTLTKANFTSNQYNGSNGDWNFAIELFNNSGVEIAGNNIQGSIDLNYNRKGSYDYSLWIHDNVSNHVPFNQKEENGIIFEFETCDVIVENNQFLNQAIGITFNMRTPNNNGGYNNTMPVGGYSACRNIIIRNNLFANLYSAYSYGNCCGSSGIQFYTEGDTKDAYVRNLLIENNTFVNKTGNAANTGIDLTHFINGTSPRADGITINKNIFIGFIDSYLTGGGSKMTNTITNENNIYQCGNGNAPSWTGSLTNTANTTVNPNLDSNYISPITGIGYQGVGVASCIYTYSAWGPCVSGTQTRTLLSTTPSGCVGTPVLSQSCSGNVAPTVNAGSNVSITLPVTSVTLNGTANDVDGSLVSYLWSKQSGPSGGTIVTPNSASTVVNTLVAGTYVYRLTVMDNSGISAFDEVTIAVQPALVANQSPVANAGVDESFVISKTITGSGTDADGTIAAYKWNKVSGPTGLLIVNPNSNTTKLQNLKVGTYVLKLTVTDNLGKKSSDTKTLTVVN